MLHSIADISGGLEPTPIPLVNHLDSSGLDFVYVRDCVGVGGSVLDREEGAKGEEAETTGGGGGRKAAVCACAEGCVNPTTCACVGYFPWEAQKDPHYLDRFLSGGVRSGAQGLDGWAKRRATASQSRSLASHCSTQAPRPRYTRTSRSAAQSCSLVLESLALEKRRREQPEPSPTDASSTGPPPTIPIYASAPPLPSLGEVKDVSERSSSPVLVIPQCEPVPSAHDRCCGGEKKEAAADSLPLSQLLSDAASDALPTSEAMGAEKPPQPSHTAAPHPTATSNGALSTSESTSSPSSPGLPSTPTSTSEVDSVLIPSLSAMDTTDSPASADRSLTNGSPTSSTSPASSSTSSSSPLPPTRLSPSPSPSPHPQSPPRINGLRPPSLPLHELSFLSECGSQCGCPSWCAARCTSGGVRLHLQVYKTAEKGWAVRTLQSIRPGTFVTEYAGEVLEADEAERRLSEYDRLGVHYMFSLKGSRRCIDPVHIGNMGRLLNHSCTPNLAQLQVYGGCGGGGRLLPTPRMVFVAKRYVHKYEELCIDYHYEEQDFPGGCMRCHCNTPRCRYNLV